VRHRTWSVNAQSGRYTPFEENDFYSPAIWRRQSPSNKQASEGEIDPADAEKLSALLAEHYDRSYALYKQALDAGVAKELARLFLPGFSVYYTWIAKVDAHNLMHWISLRMAEDAQYEIRCYAETIFEKIFKPLLPWTAEAFELYRLKR
jgi:thymidylate synthase (FAD)